MSEVHRRGKTIDLEVFRGKINTRKIKLRNQILWITLGELMYFVLFEIRNLAPHGHSGYLIARIAHLTLIGMF